jgi:hypothetical protein
MTNTIATADHAGLTLTAAEFDVTIHDGDVTLSNTHRGTHRTFRIETMADDATFAPGKRVVRLLIGPDRDDWSAWLAFGFADKAGVRVWSKHRGTDFETFADMLTRPRRWAAKGVDYLMEARCRRCGRALTHPESILTGLGPICAGKA